MSRIIFMTLINIFVINAYSCPKKTTSGFFPRNNLFIPVDAKNTSVTEDDFFLLLGNIEKIYRPIVSRYGGVLRVNKVWGDGTVNAYADQIGNIWEVNMFGGLARHPMITLDGLALVTCHEIGHHIGGFPRYPNEPWASAEGQADYFATLKCLRYLWQSDDNASIVKKLKPSQFLVKTCAENWPLLNDKNLCIRTGMAGFSVAKLFADLRNFKGLKFETPDLINVQTTLAHHANPQCRLDTYFQGSICNKSVNDEIGQEDEVSGSCHKSSGDRVGMRPGCWFRPSIE